MAENRSGSVTSVAVPLVASLLFTGGVAYLVCRLPMHHSLSWERLVLCAIVDVLVAVACQSAAAVVLCASFPDHVGVGPKALISGSWFCAAWIPALVLLSRGNSLWTAAVLPLIALSAGLFLKKTVRLDSTTDDVGASVAAGSHALFEFEEQPSFFRAVIPGILIAICFEAGLAVFIAGPAFWAGILFSACGLIAIFRSPVKPGTWTYDPKKLAGGGLVAVVFTALILFPFLRSRSVGGGWEAMLQKRAIYPRTAHVDFRVIKPPGQFYSGVILFLPPRPKDKITAPTEVNPAVVSSGHTKPVVIPFDGAYWYFQLPNLRPADDAPVVRGDPTKVNIHATNDFPISMEAHQSLGSSIATDCCRALRVQVLNADNAMGAIYLQVLLKDGTRNGMQAVSLGNLAIPSSQPWPIAPNRAPINESLTFQFPKQLRLQHFNEITVVVTTDSARLLAGSRISIKQFEFLP